MDLSDYTVTTSYQNLRPYVKSGDILFTSGNESLNRLISLETEGIFSHVAFILKIDVIDRIVVLESMQGTGVRIVPLSSYFNNFCGSGQPFDGKILIARHQEFDPSKLINFSQYAIDLLGNNYDTPELFKIAFHIILNKLGITTDTKDSYAPEYICSEYVYVCFKSIGIELPWNKDGYISPNDIANCDKIRPISWVTK